MYLSHQTIKGGEAIQVFFHFLPTKEPCQIRKDPLELVMHDEIILLFFIDEYDEIIVLKSPIGTGRAR